MELKPKEHMRLQEGACLIQNAAEVESARPIRLDPQIVIFTNQKANKNCPLGQGYGWIDTLFPHIQFSPHPIFY